MTIGSRLGLALLLLPALASAQSTGGLPALRGDLNAEVARAVAAERDLRATLVALQAQVTALQAALTTAQGTIATLQAKDASTDSAVAGLASSVNGIAASSVMGLAPYLEVTTSGTPKALLSGINLQIVNGMGRTDTKNSAGNLIIGYDEFRGVPPEYGCGRPWDLYFSWSVCPGDEKSGSHNVVVGPGHVYSSYGGLVVGLNNSATGEYASAVGGSNNRAGGSYSVTVGGSMDRIGALPPGNVGLGGHSVVVGGHNNIAGSPWSVIAGGSDNKTTQRLDYPEGVAAVFGGAGNTSSGDYSTVVGGASNEAGNYATAVGGRSNVAAGTWSTLTGGQGNTTIDPFSSILGASNMNP